MATKKKPPVKKNVSSKKNRSKTRKKTKKPKVKLDARKVLTLAAAIVTVSLVCLLGVGLVKPALENLFSSAKTQSYDAEKTETLPEKKESEVKQPAVTVAESDQKPESASKPEKSESTSKTEVPAKTEVKAEEKTEKKAEEKSVTQKEEDQKKTEQTTPTVTEKTKFEIPKAKNGARLVFVIDDAGLNVNNVKKYTELPFPITIAVLPKLSHSKDCAWVVRSAGKELILHQPMQSVNLNINPGEGAIKPDMSGSEISATLKENLSEIGPNVKGFNNHEGSLITEDLNKMTFVLGTAKEEGVYFLDSRTSVNSQAVQAALEHDMTIVERNAPFLDNTVTREAMLAELLKGLDVANRDGYAVIIGHVDKSVNILPKLLAEIYPYLVEAGYSFATPSMLLNW